MTKQKKQSATPEGIIGRSFEDEFPVIYKLVNESPSDELKQRFNDLMVNPAEKPLADEYHRQVIATISRDKK